MNNKGTMEQKNKLIPELRFPEFVKDGDWEIKTVSEVAYYENGKAHEQDIVIDGKYIVVNSKFISTDGEVVKFTNEALCLAEENDILMVLSDVPNGRAIAKCFYVDKNNLYTVNQRICKLKPFDINGKILYYLLNRNPYFLAFDDGVKQTNLKNNDVLDCPITLPKKTKDSSKEQQKIADCLSSLDELITAHNDKLETLKNHKKGLLQNLFPQEGQTTPNYRFPEFVNYGEWEEDALGKICDVRDGTHDSPKYVLKGYALITSKNLLTTGEIDSENVNYITENDYQQINKRSKVNIDDILFGMIGTIGNPVIVKKDGFAIKNVALIKSIGMIDQKFLLQQLKSNYILKQFEKENAGGILKFIALGTIRNLNIVIPSISEQKKIEKCLSTIENLITAQTEKVEQLKIHKKGLMQGLFPKIEE